MVRLSNWMAWPGTTSGRSEPLVPRPRSERLPKMRGENGKPDARVRLPLKAYPPKTFCSQLSLLHHNCVSADGRSIVDGFRVGVASACREAMTHPLAQAHAA